MEWPYRKVGLISKPAKRPGDREKLVEFLFWLRGRGIELTLDSDTAAMAGEESRLSRSELALEVEMVIVLGGDGTMLSVARALQGRDVPILGVNMGGLGFLTEVPHASVHDTLEKIFGGEYRIEERATLEVHIHRGDERLPLPACLNDVVVNYGTLARIIELDTYVDGQYLVTYRADGLIISTPTGSTGYSLAAGGPILQPTISAMILSPICPHTLTNRPLVIPDSSIVHVRPSLEKGEPAQLSLDGQEGCVLEVGDLVGVKKGPYTVKLILSRESNYWQLLRSKLGWGERFQDRLGLPEDVYAPSPTDP